MLVLLMDRNARMVKERATAVDVWCLRIEWKGRIKKDFYRHEEIENVHIEEENIKTDISEKRTKKRMCSV